MTINFKNPFELSMLRQAVVVADTQLNKMREAARENGMSETLASLNGEHDAYLSLLKTIEDAENEKALPDPKRRRAINLNLGEEILVEYVYYVDEDGVGHNVWVRIDDESRWGFPEDQLKFID